MAGRHNIKVTLGAWLDSEPDLNRAQLERLVQVYAGQRSNIRRVIVGNETLYREQLAVEDLVAHLEWGGAGSTRR